MDSINPAPRRSATDDTTATSRSRRSILSNQSIFRRFSFKDEAEKHTSPQPVVKEAYFPTYKLSWERLKAYLEEKWPDIPQSGRTVKGNNYVFTIPLDAVLDKNDIAKWRNAGENNASEQQPRASTPD